MNSLKQKLRLIVSTLALILVAHNAQAAILLDGFTDFQYAVNGVQYSDQATTNVISSLNITDTVLGHAQRSITATPIPDTATTEVVVDAGRLSISNSTDSTGTANVHYSFDNIDLTAFARAIALNISFIQPNQRVEVQMIANGSSLFAFHDFGGAGQYLVDFSQFTDSSVFTNLHSFDLQFKGPQAWDAEFALLATDTKVPEPSVTALLLIGVMAIGMVARRKTSAV